MAKKYFMKRETAKKFADKKGKKVMATSDKWRKGDKRRARKIYMVKY